MPTLTYLEADYQFATAALNWETDNIWFLLVKPEYVPDDAEINLLTAAPYELTVSGYTRVFLSLRRVDPDYTLHRILYAAQSAFWHELQDGETWAAGIAYRKGATDALSLPIFYSALSTPQATMTGYKHRHRFHPMGVNYEQL